ncbi:h domain protein [Nocardia otitidiscaviarum]|uniref:h domain protein n=1 Tax=Nocardia otitidiscaviarum TaxID=1823 RepID=UPI001892FDD6|nr:h domain protein [Nocardia otitidiscaviarum]MBF6236103.1 h domain protein [Nocardia otitidiscaviarum]
MTARLVDRFLLTGACLLLAAAVVVGSWVGYAYRQDQRAEQAREDSLVVARRAVEGMFGYNFNTIDTQMAKVSEDMTEDFKADWKNVTETVLAPGAKEKELVVQATVTGSGVISAEADHTEVMIFLNQRSTGKDPAKGTYDASRLKVRLDREGGRWLVADVDPI